MARFLIVAESNHLITNGTLVTDVDRARVKRKLDIGKQYPDGKSIGNSIEDTVFVETPPGSGVFVGEPGTPHDEWRHPVTDAPMTVNPRFYIVTTTPVPFNDPEFDKFDKPQVAADGELIQKREYKLDDSLLTPVELATILDTHRVFFNRGRTLGVFQKRPTPS